MVLWFNHSLCPQDLQSYQMYICCCPIPWLLWLKSLPEHQQLCDFTPFSSTYLIGPECISTCPSHSLPFRWGYQCCSAIAYRVKIYTKQHSRFCTLSPTDPLVYCSVYWGTVIGIINLPCMSGDVVNYKPTRAQLSHLLGELCSPNSLHCKSK